MNLINRTAVRRLALEVAAQHRPFNKFQRVSKEFLTAVEAQLRGIISHRVCSHPSKGRTLK